jgi:hypothetical protein
MQARGWSGGVGTNVQLAITPCNESLNEQLFTHNNVTGIIMAPFSAPVTGSTVCVAIKDSGPIVQASSNSCGDRVHNAFTLHARNQTMESQVENQTKCLGVERVDPVMTYQDRFWTGTDQAQYWAKPIGGGRVAVLLINPNPIAHDFVVPLANLSFPTSSDTNGFGASESATLVRDIWARRDLSKLPPGKRTLTISVGPLDSAFLRLTSVL